MRLILLKEQKRPTTKPPIEAQCGFACFDEVMGVDGLGYEEAVVSMSHQQAEAMCGWLNQQLYGIKIERTVERG